MKKIYTFLMFTVFMILIYTAVYMQSIKPACATEIKTSDYTEYISVTGEFSASDKTDISFSSPLYIDTVFVSSGGYVNKGQALFSVDKEKMYEMAKGNISIPFEKAADISSYEKLYSAGGNTAVIDSIPDIVYAPDSGIISDTSICSGAFILPDENILSIVHSENMQARFSVSQADYSKIKVGSNVSVSAAAFPGETYTGVISDKSAIIKKQVSITGSTVTIDIYADIENTDRKLADGLQISGQIQGRTEKGINVLDYSYISQDEKGEYVYILKKGRACKEYIITGFETTDYTQIKTDFPAGTLFLKGKISEGDKVIISKDVENAL